MRAEKAEALKRKLMAFAERRTRRGRRPRPAQEALRAAIREVVGWRQRWKDYIERHGAEHTYIRPYHLIYARTFNTPDVTSNNPFHVPIRCGVFDEQYIELWQRYWFASPVRRRVVREALEIQGERERARKQRGRGSDVHRDWVFFLSQGRCGVCGRWLSRKRFHLDHHEPLATGGRHTVANVQATCPRCNLRKGIGLSEIRKIYYAELRARRAERSSADQ